MAFEEAELENPDIHTCDNERGSERGMSRCGPSTAQSEAHGQNEASFVALARGVGNSWLSTCKAKGGML